MSVTAAIILLAVIWFMCLLVILPLGTRSQEQDGKIVPGTPSSAPVNPRMKRKFLITTIVTLILWALLVGVILSGAISLDDISFYGPSGVY